MSMAQGSKLVIVKTTGILRELGNICGPILHPSRLKIAKIADMVNNGKLVFEVNPEDRSQQVQLTRLNVTSENFKKMPTTEAPVEEKVVPPDTKGETVDVSGVGSIAREVIDPTYTPEENKIATMASVEETPVVADEVSEDETVESDSVAEEESDESSEVDASQQNDMQTYVHMSRKERKKNKNRNGSDFSAR